MSKLLDTIKSNKEVIMVASGIGITIAGLFAAKKSTLKCKEVLKTHKENIEIIEEVFEVAREEEYNAEDRKNDLKTNRIQTAASLAKIYAVPSTLVLCGLYMTTSNIVKITKRRVCNE